MERKTTKYTKKERDQYLEENKTSSLSIGVGVAVIENCSRGMKKQVGKT